MVEYALTTEKEREELKALCHRLVDAPWCVDLIGFQGWTRMVSILDGKTQAPLMKSERLPDKQAMILYQAVSDVMDARAVFPDLIRRLIELEKQVEAGRKVAKGLAGTPCMRGRPGGCFQHGVSAWCKRCRGVFHAREAGLLEGGE